MWRFLFTGAVMLVGFGFLVVALNRLFTVVIPSLRRSDILAAEQRRQVSRTVLSGVAGLGFLTGAGVLFWFWIPPGPGYLEAAREVEIYLDAHHPGLQITGYSISWHDPVGSEVEPYYLFSLRTSAGPKEVRLYFDARTKQTQRIAEVIPGPSSAPEPIRNLSSPSGVAAGTAGR